MAGAKRGRCSRRAMLAAMLVMVQIGAHAAAISYEGERDLGRSFDLALRQRATLVDDPEVVGHVNRIGQRIAGTLDDSHFDYQFAVIRDARVNAFAVPGGFIYVNSGLLAQLDNDDELAGVLAHEIGHVHAHHAVRQQQATQALNYAALLGTLLSAVQPVAGVLASAAANAVVLEYRRESEQEADYLAARYLQSAGFDPRAMLDFFDQLRDDAGFGAAAALPYLRSHPVTDERLNNLEAVLKTQQWAAHERSRPSFELQRARALARVRTQPPGEVLRDFHRAVDADPSDALSQYLFGVVSLQIGDLESALPALTAARAGGIAAADRELGAAALRQRDAAAARDFLASHLAREPSDPGARVQLGRALEALGDTAAAMAEYQRSVDLAPDLASAHHGLGLLAGRAGREGEGFYHLATAARLSGDYPTALTQYRRAAQALPGADPHAGEARRWSAALADYLRVSVPAPAPAAARR